MKALPQFFAVSLIASFFLSSCVWQERMVYELNLQANTFKIGMYNLFSASEESEDKKTWTVQDVQNDWQSFITDYTNDSLFLTQGLTLKSKRLFEENSTLNCEIVFSFENLTWLSSNFNELDFTVDSATIKLKKQDDMQTNGELVTKDSTFYFVWPISTDLIRIESTTANLEKAKKEGKYKAMNSFISYWRAWKEQ